MRKIFVFLLLVVFLSACNNSQSINTISNSDDDNKENMSNIDNPFSLEGFGGDYEYALNIIKDNGTGCEYILFVGSYKSAITPRFGSDGKQICR